MSRVFMADSAASKVLGCATTSDGAVIPSWYAVGRHVTVNASESSKFRGAHTEFVGGERRAVGPARKSVRAKCVRSAAETYAALPPSLWIAQTMTP